MNVRYHHLPDSITAAYLLHWISRVRAAGNDVRIALDCHDAQECLFRLIPQHVSVVSRMKPAGGSPPSIRISGNIPLAAWNMVRNLAREAGLPIAIDSLSDLLFDIRPMSLPYRTSTVLFVNQPPSLTGWPEYNRDRERSVIKSITDRGLSVVTTETLKDALEIGWMASFSNYIIGYSTVEMALTFNRLTANKTRGWLVMDTVDSFPFNSRCRHARNHREAVTELRTFGLV